MATDTHNLTVLAAATKPPRVAIDEELRVVLDGTQPVVHVVCVGVCTTSARQRQPDGTVPAEWLQCNHAV
jgi:hypothetical protein